jgi:hypothetical protein
VAVELVRIKQLLESELIIESTATDIVRINSLELEESYLYVIVQHQGIAFIAEATPICK